MENKKYRVIFISGVLDHINLPICLELKKHYGDSFLFLSTIEMPASRLAIGYGKYDDLYDFVLPAYESEDNFELARKLTNDADIVLYGSVPKRSLIRSRLRSKKITFQVSERFFKEKTTFKNFWRRVVGILIHYYSFPQRNKYILCEGGYVANDLDICHLYRNKRLKWGYFTNYTNKPFLDLINEKSKNAKLTLLWVGRFVALKRPRIAINLAKFLDENHIDFELKMVGYGPILEECRIYAEQLGLSNKVIFTGALNLEEKEKTMNEAKLFLFTSAREEGWGAVVNEAMGSACVVIASAEAGAPTALIEDGRNGYLFKNGNQIQLNNLVADLAKDIAKNTYIQENAYTTIHNLWNHEIAVDRLSKIIDSLLERGTFSFEKDGPCSEAIAIK